MKVLLNIKDEKADLVMELLQNIPFVKAEAISESKAKFLNEFRKAVKEVKQSKKGKLNLKTADQLINEL